MLTAERCRELFDYDAETGDLIWRVKTARKVVVGRKAGSLARSGCGKLYWSVRCDRRRYLAHRVAWLWVHGAWPPDQIDHINCDGLDNRLVNLRLATAAENLRNKPLTKKNTSGRKGVTWHPIGKKWVVHICADGKQRHIGMFKTLDDAAKAYERAAKELHGEFARVA